jgi:hypothetical protein
MRQNTDILIVCAALGVPCGGYVVDNGQTVIVVDETLTPDETDRVVWDVLARLGVEDTDASD